MNKDGKGGFVDNPDHINRKGRPKKGETLTDALRAITNKDEIAQHLTDMAFGETNRGDISALKYIYDRIDGKPTETHHQIIENLPDIVEID